MTIFSRLNDIISSNIHAIVDKASDPLAISKLMVQEMQESLVQLKANVSHELINLKLLEKELETKTAQKVSYESKAVIAVEHQRDDLAIRVLDEVILLEKQIERLQLRKSDLSLLIEEQRKDIKEVESKITEARDRTKALEKELKAAKPFLDFEKHRALANEKIQSLDNEISRLNTEGTMSVYRKSIEQELSDLETQVKIEKRLADLKEKIKASSAA